MKYLSLLTMMALTMTLHAQTASSSGSVGAAVQGPGQTAASAAATESISAELTKKIDTKNAKLGDLVTARTMSTIRLADGTKLPSGTKLVGRVTAVHAKSDADKSSHLAFSLDHAVLHGGREIPMHLTLTSVSAPAPASAEMTDSMQDSEVASGSATRAAGIGMPGARLANNATSGLVSGTGSTLQSTTAGISNTTRTAGNIGGTANAAAALQPAHAQVVNLSGVTFSGTVNTDSSGVLDAANKNISLDSGTVFTFALAVNQ